MTKVYCVINSGGSWEDYYRFIEKSFFSEEKAIEYMNKKNEWLKKQKEIERQKEEICFETDVDAMTEEEYRTFYKKYDFDYDILYERNEYSIEVINVE